MALTSEDIVNKRFQSTKFREGYDQDEVDDFLDEVVVEMRRVVAENDELAQKMAASEGRIAELQRAGGAASSVGVVPVASVSEAVDTENANNLLQLARRLHEEHVREGIQKRDELIAEGHAQAARLVAEAETDHREATAKLGYERSIIQGQVDQLRSFEREYRSSLKDFIITQLGALESTSAPATVPGATTPA
jgi:DivIVA domain-containing protein